MEQGVLDVVKLKYWSFIPRRGSGRREERAIDPGVAPRGDRARAATGAALSEDELTALFAETRPEVIEEMRVAADELRAELAGERGDVRRQPQHQLHQRLRRRLRLLRLRPGHAARPTPTTSAEEDFQARVGEAVDFGATEICMQGGIHPDYTLEDYGRWLRLAKEVAPQIHLHAYSPMEVHYMCERSGRRPDAVFDYLIECGLGSTPGTAAEVLDDGVRAADLAEQAAGGPLGRDHRGLATAPGLRSTSTVMFGHIEEPRELARHMRVVRELQERTGGITEFVPLSFIPFNTLLGRTHGIEEISAEENLKHTAAFRLALGRTITNLQASWVKMGLDAATESLRWGVNDLGGTLMEENISRMAGSQHGVRLEPEQLIAAARAAGRDAGPAHDALRDRRDVLGRREGDAARPGRARRSGGGGRPIPSPGPARSCCGSRLRRLPHRPARRRRRARPSRSCRSSPATRSSARCRASARARSASRPATGVGVPWLGWACGECRYCRAGARTSASAPGSPATTSTAATRSWRSPTSASASRIPERYADAEAAPLLCAGLIGYRALRLCGDAGAARPLRLRRRRPTSSARSPSHQGRRVFAFTRDRRRRRRRPSRCELGAEWAGTSDERRRSRSTRRSSSPRSGELVPAGAAGARAGRRRGLRRHPHERHPVLSLRDPLGRARLALGREPDPPRRRGVPAARARRQGSRRR